jgi:hypothetical protein
MVADQEALEVDRPLDEVGGRAREAGEIGFDLLERDALVRPRKVATVILVTFEDRPAMPADLRRGRAAGLTHPPHQLDRRRRVDLEPARRSARGATRIDAPRNPFA